MSGWLTVAVFAGAALWAVWRRQPRRERRAATVMLGFAATALFLILVVRV